MAQCGNCILTLESNTSTNNAIMNKRRGALRGLINTFKKNSKPLEKKINVWNLAIGIEEAAIVTFTLRKTIPIR